MLGSTFVIDSTNGEGRRQLTGAPKIKYWTITAKPDAVVGTEALFHAIYRRPWETDVWPAKEISFTLRVV